MRANQIGRFLAIVVFALLGLALLFPGLLADYLTRPLVRLGGRVQGQNSAEAPSIGRSVLLGRPQDYWWAPCAGPILGLILTGAALQEGQACTQLFCCYPFPRALQLLWPWHSWLETEYSQ